MWSPPTLNVHVFIKTHLYPDWQAFAENIIISLPSGFLFVFANSPYLQIYTAQIHMKASDYI